MSYDIFLAITFRKKVIGLDKKCSSFLRIEVLILEGREIKTYCNSGFTRILKCDPFYNKLGETASTMTVKKIHKLINGKFH